MLKPAAAPVVIVEDDPSMTQALKRILRLDGYASRAFTSAEDCLAEARGLGAACLIIDVQLPGITGFELYDRLFAGANGCPVIFITAFDDAEARSRAERARAVAFLTKPFSGRLLLDSVKHALWRRGLH